MFPPRHKTAAFALEGMNSIATTFYFYHVFFFLRDVYGFGARENLLWAIAHGVVYVFASWQGGQLGQRHGYLRVMRWGFGGMSATFLIAWLVHRAGLPRGVEIPTQVALMLVATVSICLTWPNLEAVVSEGEPGPRLNRLLGIYNLVWSGGNAVAYFSGGALAAAWGAGNQVFLVPALIIAAQFGVVTWMMRSAGPGMPGPATGHGPMTSDAERRRATISPRAFLWMAWISNPCAYVAVSAAIPLMPTLAAQLGLNARAAGFFCSIWLFARTLTFLGLWRWGGWHYRFRWLALACIGMIAGFLFLFLSGSIAADSRGGALALAVTAQVVFGLGLGLIYYSSLFYSMDVGETKAEHGGFHEAAIGLGILGGPVVGTVAEAVLPGSTSAAAWGVSAVLCGGMGVIGWLRWRGARDGGSGN